MAARSRALLCALTLVCCAGAVAAPARAQPDADVTLAVGNGRHGAAAPRVPEPTVAPRPGTPTHSPTPSPSASPTGSPSGSSSQQPGQDTDGGGCSAFDIGCKVRHAIDDWLRGLVRSAINPVIGGLGTTVLASPHVERMDRVRQLWSASAWIANTSFVLLVLAAGFLLMGHGSVQTSYTVKEVAPRLVVGFVASNISLLVIGQVIEFANGLSGALMGQGVPVDQAAEKVKQLVGEVIVASLTGRGPLILAIVALIALVLALVLTLIYLIRIMLLTMLAGAAPLALACHALPHTEGLARLWWRAFGGVMAVQVAQALVLITTLRIFFDPSRSTLFAGANPVKSFLDLLLLICLLYILIRIPSWISRLVFRGGMRSSPITRIVRYAVAAAVFRRAIPAFAGRIGGSASSAGGGGSGGRWKPLPPPDGPAPTAPTGAQPPGAQPWVQPELPAGRPSPRGTQMELPVNPSPKPGGQRWTQLRLPAGHTRQPSWQQTRLPIRIQAEQQQLPLTIPPQPVQQQLPLTFPQRGTAEAGSSPRRAQQAAAMRHAAELQARARDRQMRDAAAGQQQTSRSSWWRWGGSNGPDTSGGRRR